MNEVRRRKKKKRFFGGDPYAYYAMGVVIALALSMLLCLTVFFRIDNIQVEGVTLYRNDQIINIGGITKDMNLVRTDVHKAEQRLADNLVYIDKVEIKKAYPSTVIIKCTEAVKAADIEEDGKYYVLSFSGRILESANSQPTGGIPIIKGFELKSKKAGSELEAEDGYKSKILLNLLRELDAQQYTQVEQIDLSSRANIVISYENRLELDIGSSADISYKLSYFKAVINSLTKDYKGTLIYNGTDNGISAIPRDRLITKPNFADDDSDADEEDTNENLWSMEEDDSAADEANNENSWSDNGNSWDNSDNGWQDTNTWDNGTNTWDNGNSWDNGANTWDTGNTWDNGGW